MVRLGADLTSYRPHPNRAYVYHNGLGYMGQQQLYTPYPWVPEDPTRAERREDRWARWATVVAVLGGLAGLLVSLRALRR